MVTVASSGLQGPPVPASGHRYSTHFGLLHPTPPLFPLPFPFAAPAPIPIPRQMPIFGSGLLANFPTPLLLQLAVCATNSINEPETEIHTQRERQTEGANEKWRGGDGQHTAWPGDTCCKLHVHGVCQTNFTKIFSLVSWKCSIINCRKINQIHISRAFFIRKNY